MVAGLVGALVIYLRGWRILHRSLPVRFPVWRAWAFTTGLGLVWIAVASPLDAFAGLLLSVHMVQHLLLLMAAPPLLLLGAPILPMLRGLPRRFAREGLGPFLIWPPLRRVGSAITHPTVCWLAMAVTLVGWHAPAAFGLTLRSSLWHKTEHVCFLCASLLFWWPVIRPFPSHARWPRWSIPFYLLGADLTNTALSAVLTFSDHPLYRHYALAPRLFGISVLGDQACAGVIMWVPGSLAFLVPAVVSLTRTLAPQHALVRPGARGAEPPTPARLKPPRLRDFDLLSLPLLGPVLRSLTARRVLQSLLLTSALAVVADGFRGPPQSAGNLAGLLVWTHWRLLVGIGLLAVGNLFCMVCPFTLAGKIGRLLGLRQRPWPHWLRSKWPAIGLLALFFGGCETFAVRDSPRLTASLVVAYILAAFLVGAFFRKAAFCKYLCPIGQFQFAASSASPFEVRVRETDICARCTTHDCLRGGPRSPGCEMELHLPSKSGNLDCTFCLDCVRACPKDNIGLILVGAPRRASGGLIRSRLGRLTQRTQIAALSLVFVLAAFANAALMTTPAIALCDLVAVHLRLSSYRPVAGALFLALLIPVAGSLVAFTDPIRRFAPSLVPLGLSMWVGHALFHFSASWGALSLIIERIAGRQSAAETYALFDATHLEGMQTALLDAGLLLALYIAWHAARAHWPTTKSALVSAAPWAGFAVALYAVGIWIVLQPMGMSGM
jgi:cytochrome c oxidase assembly factor CtaG/polyferredoxin